jgi:hypothetical protein
MLCTLDYEKYKPITEHTPHNDLIFYKSVIKPFTNQLSSHALGYFQNCVHWNVTTQTHHQILF